VRDYDKINQIGKSWTTRVQVAILLISGGENKLAIVRKLERLELEKDSSHSEADCTYDIIVYGGEKFLQIDTYGSKQRKFLGKKSQSIRFSKSAIEQLKLILKDNF